MAESLLEQVRVEDTISPGLFESHHRSVNSLPGSCESTCSQHLDLLGMVNFGAHVDYFLLHLCKFLGKVLELQDFSFDEWIA